MGTLPLHAVVGCMINWRSLMEMLHALCCWSGDQQRWLSRGWMTNWRPLMEMLHASCCWSGDQQRWLSCGCMINWRSLMEMLHAPCCWSGDQQRSLNAKRLQSISSFPNCTTSFNKASISIPEVNGFMRDTRKYILPPKVVCTI
jgi:hypothetical protein